MILVLTSMFGTSGCSAQGGKTPEAKIAETLLQKKYNEEFVIYSMGKRYGTLTGNTFTVMCSPKDNPNLKFNAEIDKDGSFMQDEYVSRKVSDLIEKDLTKTFSKNFKDFVIKVGAAGKTTDSNNSNMSIQEYFKLKNDTWFAIYIVIDKDNLKDVSDDTIYNSISDTVGSVPNLSGGLKVYVVTKGVLQKAITYFKDYANLDSSFDELVSNPEDISSGFENGVLKMKLDEFKLKLK